MIDGEKNRLDSWKAIAEYLHRDVSTVMRWGRERKLPVHRVPGGKGHSVFAYREELEAWMAGQTDSQVSQTTLATRSVRFKRLWIGVPALIVCVGLGALIRVRTLGPEPAARVTFSGNKLVASDDRGRLSWTYAFPTEVSAAPGVSHPVRTVDLDGDGRNEVLAIAAVLPQGQENIGREQILCLSDRGELLWRYEPLMTLSFGGRRWDGPWVFKDLVVSIDGTRKDIWAAVAHNTWWPSFLIRLDPNGASSVRLINSGTIYALNVIETASGSYVLAGGVNNEYGAGMFAIVDVRQDAAVSPQTRGTPYYCDQCQGGQPYGYFLLPPAELTTLLGHPYNVVRGIRVHERHLQIDAYEYPQPYSEWSFYDLSQSFDFETASLGDGYRSTHGQLEREGKLTHTVEHCPELTKPKIVRRWKPQGGWTDVPVRWAAPPQ